MKFPYLPNDFTVVSDVTDSDFEYMMPADLIPKYQALHRDYANDIPVVHEVKQTIAEYPQSPQLYNLLTLAYERKGDRERMSKVNEEMLQLFPHYIYAKINKAKEYIAKADFDGLDAFIDPTPSIKAHLPHRTIFYADEFATYEVLAAEYLLIDEATDEAAARVRAALVIIPGEIEQGFFAMNIFRLIAGYMGMDEITGELKKLIPELQQHIARANSALRAKTGRGDDDEDGDNDFEPYEKSYDQSVQTDEPPVFLYPDAVAPLYRYGFDLPEEAMQTLLALPREALAKDMSTALRDAVYRYECFENLDDGEGYFPYHAMNVIRTAMLTECVPDMLYFLEQGDELVDFYMGDITHEGLWQVFYPFCSTSYELIKKFLFMPGIYSFNKATLMQALTQYSLHNPSASALVEALYKQLCDWQYAERDNAQVLNPVFNHLLVTEIAYASFVNLEPEVTRLCNAELVDCYGDDPFTEWKECIVFFQSMSRKKSLLNWPELNAHLAEKFRH